VAQLLPYGDLSGVASSPLESDRPDLVPTWVYKKNPEQEQQDPLSVGLAVTFLDLAFALDVANTNTCHWMRLIAACMRSGYHYCCHVVGFALEVSLSGAAQVFIGSWILLSRSGYRIEWSVRRFDLERRGIPAHAHNRSVRNFVAIVDSGRSSLLLGMSGRKKDSLLESQWGNPTGDHSSP
jgi:hypothetical protein